MIRNAFTLGAVVGFFLGLSLSCGQGAPRCLTSNCDGCCDSAGQCRKGSEQNACGRKAFLCVDCGSDHACVDQACVPVGDGGVGGGSGTGGRDATGGVAGGGGPGGNG